MAVFRAHCREHRISWLNHLTQSLIDLAQANVNIAVFELQTLSVYHILHQMKGIIFLSIC